MNTSEGIFHVLQASLVFCVDTYCNSRPSPLVKKKLIINDLIIITFVVLFPKSASLIRWAFKSNHLSSNGIFVCKTFFFFFFHFEPRMTLKGCSDFRVFFFVSPTQNAVEEFHHVF